MQERTNLEWVYSLLRRACSSKKELKAVTLEEFQQAGKALPQLPSFNDKGLLIIVLSKVIMQKFLAFPKELQLLQNKMFPPQKATRQRRHVNDDDEVQPRRRRRVRANDKDIDLHELSNESLTNPVNVQPKVEGEIRVLLGRDGAQEIPEDQQQMPELAETNFSEVINERQRKIQAQKEASRKATDNSQDNSNSNSSSEQSRFGAITNLNKKLEILGLTGGLNDRTILVDRTVRRPRQPASSNRPTRRKNKEQLDQKTMLDETGPTINHNESMEATMEAVRARRKRPQDYEIMQRFKSNLDSFSQFINKSIFSQKNCERLKLLSKKVRPEQRTRIDIEMPQEVITEFSDPTEFTDTTLFEPGPTLRKLIDSNIFQSSDSITLSQLSENTPQNKAKIFMKLLWMDQQSEISLSQDDPSHFSDIIVHRKVQK